MDMEEIQSNRAVDLLAENKQLKAQLESVKSKSIVKRQTLLLQEANKELRREIEEFNHAIEHALGCDKTKLCEECKQLLNQVYDPNWTDKILKEE